MFYRFPHFYQTVLKQMVHDATAAAATAGTSKCDLDRGEKKKKSRFTLLKIYSLQVLVWLEHHKGPEMHLKSIIHAHLPLSKPQKCPIQSIHHSGTHLFTSSLDR